MGFFIGLGVVIASVMSGYLLSGGHAVVLWQPFEFMIIMGAAIGSFIIANPSKIRKGLLKRLPKLYKGPSYKRAAYVELLVLLNAVFKMSKAKGAMALESHVEKPHDSTLFQQFPIFHHDHHAVEFFCDFFRMLIMGADNPHEIEALMDQRLDVHHHQEEEIAGALQAVADAMPALGIVAAVLGVIHTMGSITEPPEVLGHLIGGALVGTFFGILMAYGFLAPMASQLKAVAEEDSRYLACIKAGIVAYIQGYAPIMAVESARMVLESQSQPSFSDLEAAIEAKPITA